MPAAIEFFDMAVTVTPPSGHFEPQPVTLGASWQPNDVRLLLVSAGGKTTQSNSTTLMMPMDPDPPTGYTSAYSMNATKETKGVFYQQLSGSSVDAAIAWPKPPDWRHFMLATLTARGTSPTVLPTAGKLSVSYTVGGATASVSSVAVPAAGTMVFFLGTFGDPGGGWPSWPSALGVPSGWTHMVATDKSGLNYYPYDPNPALIVIGKSFTSAGSTGTVSVPVGSGSPAFAGLYCFIRPAPDVSVAIGAA